MTVHLHLPTGTKVGRMACWFAAGVLLIGAAVACGRAARTAVLTQAVAAQPTPLDSTTAFLRQATPIIRAAARLGVEQARVLSHAGPQASLRGAALESLRNLARGEESTARELRQLGAPARFRRATFRLAAALGGDAQSAERLLKDPQGPVTRARVAAYAAVARSAGLVKTAFGDLDRVVRNYVQYLTRP